MSFKELLTEAKTVKELVKTLKDYDATIVLHSNPSEKDVIHWAKGSIDYADDFSADFDMSEQEFIAFCKQVLKTAAEISKAL